MTGKQKRKIKMLMRTLKRVRSEVYIGALAVLLFIIVLFILFRRPHVKPSSFSHYQKMKLCEPVELCAQSSGKTYEDYRMITDPTSNQYRLIHDHLTVDSKTGFLTDKDGFLAAALGYRFGDIGTRYYFTLDSGIILPLIKADEKAPKDASDGCAVDINGTVIEFVIDAEAALDYFGTISNGLVLDGNYNNSPYFAGRIVKMERVKD